MNKPSDSDDRLLADTFHDAWATGPAAAFARAAAAHARRRRRAKQALASTAGIAAALLLGFALWPRSTPPTPQVAAVTRPAALPLTPTTPPAAAPTRGYEVISDDELIARLNDRPFLAVEQANGGRKIVLLETAETAPAEPGAFEE